MRAPSRIADILKVLKLPTRAEAKRMIKEGKVPETHKRLIAMIAAGKIPTGIKSLDDEEEEAA